VRGRLTTVTLGTLDGYPVFALTSVARRHATLVTARIRSRDVQPLT
jgi:hypothetical protein